MRHGKRAAQNRRFESVVRAAAVFSIAVAFSVAAFIFLGSLPAIKELGLSELFGFLWQPQKRRYGIAAMLITSFISGGISAAVAFFISSLGAAWLNNFAPRAVLPVVKRLCAVLSSVPSIIFGLWGLVVLIPLLQRLSPDKTAQSGGASLLAAIIVLIILQIPFMLPECITALRQAAKFDVVSAALGADEMQTLFLSQFFHAKWQLSSVLLAGIRRAFCETMAVQFVSGNIVSLPKLFGSVRLLGAGLMLEMGYAQGVHRSALFFIGLIMLAAALLTELFSKKK
ncbi:MAG: hypothetical protein J6A76_05895 [Oscillospiraceae bacterium]|nr:hypothetical protein [Oscillospiraceae bacterium]